MRTGDPGWVKRMILTCWFSLGVGGAAWADVFDGFRDAPAPEVIREVSDPAADLAAGESVRVRRLVFRSVPAPGWTNEIYAVVARPATEGTHPGVLICHGGLGVAAEDQAVVWARWGYVAVSLDQPGIADPLLATRSGGAWRHRPYGSGHWRPFPTGEPVVIEQAVVAGLQAFALLRDQPDVDPERIGIMGWSWGGYMTTMLCGLLGDRVAAGFSYFGTGFYEMTSFSLQLGSVPAGLRESWLATLDAGRRAGGITAPFFIGSPANDLFFYPPAVERTLSVIPGAASRVYSPNTHHWLAIPGGMRWSGDEQMAGRWLDWNMRGLGEPFPTVTWEESTDPDVVTFRVTGPRPFLAVTLWHSLPLYPEHWPDRIWTEVPVRQRGEGVFEAVLPRHRRPVGAAWFATASDDRPMSVSAPMRFAADGFGAGVFFWEDFQRGTVGEAVPGWSGSLKAMADPTGDGGNRVGQIGTGDELGQEEGMWEMPVFHAATNGIQMGFRFRVGDVGAGWKTEWMVSGNGAGRGFRISAGGIGFVGLGEAGQEVLLGEIMGFGESVGIRTDAWNEVEFTWRANGTMELQLNGAFAARLWNPGGGSGVGPGFPLGFGKVRMTDRGGENGGRMVYDDIGVWPWTGPATPPLTLNLLWIGSPTKEGDRWRILHGFEGVPGRAYGIQTSGTLRESGWEELGEFPTGETGVFVVPVEVGNPEGEDTRYFRATRSGE